MVAIHGVLVDGKLERVDCDLDVLKGWMENLSATGTAVVHLFSADREKEFGRKRKLAIKRLESNSRES